MRSDPSRTDGSDIIIRADNLWKRYGLGPALMAGLRRMVGLPDDETGPWALSDLSLQLKRGQSLGILGRNGAGKSSLLKVLAGVTQPSRGTVTTSGSIFPMIELNAGLHSELTGRENVRLLGAVMGLAARAIEKQMPEFEAFCELGEWFDRPVRTYSSGMLARLGFAVAMNVEADVLLIDEVLAVGDLAFQHKCLEALWARKKRGATLIFVSHSLRQVEHICDYALWLDQGRVVQYDKAHAVCAAYSRGVKQAAANSKSSETYFQCVPGIGAPTVIVQSEEGEAVLKCGEAARILISFDTEVVIEQPLVEIKVFSADMIPITSVNNAYTERKTIDNGVAKFECVIPRMPLMPGIYALGLIVRSATGARMITGDRVLWFEIIDPSYHMQRNSTGIVYFDTQWVQI